MKGNSQIIMFKAFSLWRFAVRRSNISSHLVIPTLSCLVITYSSPTIFIQLKGATFIKFLAFPMRRIFEDHIFFKSQPLKIAINHLTCKYSAKQNDVLSSVSRLNTEIYLKLSRCCFYFQVVSRFLLWSSKYTPHCCDKVRRLFESSVHWWHCFHLRRARRLFREQRSWSK